MEGSKGKGRTEQGNAEQLKAVQSRTGHSREGQCTEGQGLTGHTFQGILKGGMRGSDVAWTSTPSTVILAGGVWSAEIGFSMTLVEGRAW